jgi:hypothetical protein
VVARQQEAGVRQLPIGSVIEALREACGRATEKTDLLSARLPLGNFHARGMDCVKYLD